MIKFKPRIYVSVESFLEHLNGFQFIFCILYQVTKLVINKELVCVWSVIYSSQFERDYSLLKIKNEPHYLSYYILTFSCSMTLAAEAVGWMATRPIIFSGLWMARRQRIFAPAPSPNPTTLFIFNWNRMFTRPKLKS